MRRGWTVLVFGLLMPLAVGFLPAPVAASHCEPGGSILPWPGFAITGTVAPFEMRVYRIRTTLPVPEAVSGNIQAPVGDHPTAITFASSGDAMAFIMQVTNEGNCHISSVSLAPSPGGCFLPDDVPVCYGASVVLDGRTTWIEVVGDVRSPFTYADFALAGTAPANQDLA